MFIAFLRLMRYSVIALNNLIINDLNNIKSILFNQNLKHD